MIAAIENIKNDTVASPPFAEDGVFAAFFVLVLLIITFYFIVLKKCLPLAKGGVGGVPLNSKAARMAIMAIVAFGIFSLVLESIILKLIATGIVLAIAWIIDVYSDDDVEW